MEVQSAAALIHRRDVGSGEVRANHVHRRHAIRNQRLFASCTSRRLQLFQLGYPKSLTRSLMCTLVAIARAETRIAASVADVAITPDADWRTSSHHGLRRRRSNGRDHQLHFFPAAGCQFARPIMVASHLYRRTLERPPVLRPSPPLKCSCAQSTHSNSLTRSVAFSS